MWPGLQRAWRLCDDGRGWVAEVEFTVRQEWGFGKHLAAVPATRCGCRWPILASSANRQESARQASGRFRHDRNRCVLPPSAPYSHVHGGLGAYDRSHRRAEGRPRPDHSHRPRRPGAAHDSDDASFNRTLRLLNELGADLWQLVQTEHFPRMDAYARIYWLKRRVM